MKYVDGFTILAISLLTACLCEGISWLLIYRTARYKGMRASIERTTKKVESMKEKPALASNKSRTKKIDRFESSLKDANKALAQSKVQSTVVVGLTMLLVFGLLGSIFDGKAVAKIPFRPFSMIQRVTHRNLPGEDMTDCSFTFLYMLCSMTLRPNLQKLLGFAPPRGAPGAQGMFGIPEQKIK
eukprot:TRINITY_DN30388_c0_g1_i1.p1 TRINITY_DN30388_c0_g1~~TRINITY_DN30388_c0_g1_i1.p1  ORF type:complete len:184 (+),score=39.63 TRINITY_DN30388_c0_g1_i1:421-972(+)